MLQLSLESKTLRLQLLREATYTTHSLLLYYSITHSSTHKIKEYTAAAWHAHLGLLHVQQLAAWSHQQLQEVQGGKGGAAQEGLDHEGTSLGGGGNVFKRWGECEEVVGVDCEALGGAKR